MSCTPAALAAARIFALGAGIEAADILTDRGIEQRHFLRQIADVAAQHIRRPLPEVGIVQADIAAQQRPHACKSARKRRFAAAARADDAGGLAGLQLEARSPKTTVPVLGAATVIFSTFKLREEPAA